MIEAQRKAYGAGPVTILRPNESGRLVKVATVQITGEVKEVSYGRSISAQVHEHRKGKTAKGNTTRRKAE